MAVDGVPQPTSVTVHLPDLEPVLGLVAACSRLCMALGPEAVAAMGDHGQDALAQIQSILWRLEHAHPEKEG